MGVIVNNRYRLSIQTECEQVELNDMLYLFPQDEDLETLVYELEEKEIRYRITKKKRNEFV